MTPASTYKAFLASPSASALHEDATLQYITTLTSHQGPAPILKHLTSSQLKRHGENVVELIEGRDALFAVVETNVEFITAGGAYLPGLDDNFLADHKVTFPVQHVVRFVDGKIKQIRLSWDQGSLLRAVDVIGSRGRNWPIMDTREQVKMWSSGSEALNGPSKGVPQTPLSKNTAGGKPDPYSSLDLFTPREVTPEHTAPPSGITDVRASARPPPRDYSELFASQEPEASPSASRGKSFAGGQQSHDQPVPAKTGQPSRNYQPSRIFDDGEDETPQPTPQPKGQAGRRYEHFELGDSGDKSMPPPAARPTSKASKNASHWDFETFATPIKPGEKIRGQDVRHFGWSDDEVEDEAPPAAKPRQTNQPRRDAETHFEMRDDGTPIDPAKKAAAAQRQKGTAHNKAMGLYENQVWGREESPQKPYTEPSRPLSNVTNNTNNSHHRTFESHFDIRDDSPADDKSAPPQRKAPDHKAAVKMMENNWDTYDESPIKPRPAKDQQPGEQENRGNVTAHRPKSSTSMQRHWGFGDDEADVEYEKKNTRPISRRAEANQGGGFWDYQ